MRFLSTSVAVVVVGHAQSVECLNIFISLSVKLGKSVNRFMLFLHTHTHTSINQRCGCSSIFGSVNISVCVCVCFFIFTHYANVNLLSILSGLQFFNDDSTDFYRQLQNNSNNNDNNRKQIIFYACVFHVQATLRCLDVYLIIVIIIIVLYFWLFFERNLPKLVHGQMTRQK